MVQVRGKGGRSSLVFHVMELEIKHCWRMIIKIREVIIHCIRTMIYQKDRKTYGTMELLAEIDILLTHIMEVRVRRMRGHMGLHA